MKKNLTASLLLIAILAMILIGSYSRANAGQYDIIYLIRTGTGTGNVSTYYPGTSGTWQAIGTTATNGFLQTTGTGIAVNASPVITGTANIPGLSPGTLGISASGTLVIYGTNNAWRNVP
jgi:hypothetical protein